MDTAPVFCVGDVPVYGDSILAPMDGFSDQPFRGIARRLGSAMSYTEFINAIEVVNRHKSLPKKLAFEDFERPVVFQLYDEDPERLLRAAEALMPLQPDILDINMGCSSRSIAARGAGAGLLRTPDKIGEIIGGLSASFDVPITAKIRLGWDDQTLNYVEVARIVEGSGGKLIAVHGRTKEQAYRGRANWGAIAEIKQAVSIPVIGNGDIRTVADKTRMMGETGCDAVMIGRGAIGNPWIFQGVDRARVSRRQVREMICLHLARMQDFYGSERGLVLFRKHAARYISQYPLTKTERTQLLTCGTSEEFVTFIDQLYFDREIRKEKIHA